jgi:hypothetical protein
VLIQELRELFLFHKSNCPTTLILLNALALLTGDRKNDQPLFGYLSPSDGSAVVKELNPFCKGVKEGVQLVTFSG